MPSTMSDYFMSCAISAANQSVSTRWKVGAVFVDSASVLASGHNHMPLTSPTPNCEVTIPCLCSDNCRCDGSGFYEASNDFIIHAEVAALSSLLLKGLTPSGLSLYITHAPCLNCAKLLSTLNLREVVYMAPFSNSGGLDFFTTYKVPFRRYAFNSKGTL